MKLRALLVTGLVCLGSNACNTTRSTETAIVASTPTNTRWDGLRQALPVDWRRVWLGEFQNHVRAPRGPLKTHPQRQDIRDGSILSPHAGVHLPYLWVAVVIDGRLIFRWAPEKPMPPGTPMSGVNKDRPPMYGHPTLTGWDPAVSGGEIRFKDDAIWIDNDSGRINFAYPDTTAERQAFCRSVDTLERLTRTDMVDVWYDWVRIRRDGGKIPEDGRHTHVGACGR